MPERIEQHQLARRVGQVIVAAQHVRDAHGGIVDGVAEEERGRAVLAPDDEIADVVRREAAAARAPDRRTRSTVASGTREAQRRLAVPRASARGALRRGQGAAGAGIARRLARHALELARRARAPPACRSKDRRARAASRRANSSAIPGAALGLQVRGARAPDIRSLVPVEARASAGPR